MSRLLWGLAISVCLAGCSRSDLPELAPVTGLVTLNGEPLSNAIVTFTPTAARPSVGETDESGRFELMYLPEVDGALLGEHKVTVRLIQDEEADNLPEGSDQAVTLPEAAYDGSITKQVTEDGNDFQIEL